MRQVCSRCGKWHKRLIKTVNTMEKNKQELFCLDCLAELIKGRA
jgi:hypothetical protein